MSFDSSAISNRVCVTHMYFIYFIYFFPYNVRTTYLHSNLGKWLLDLRNDVNSPLVNVIIIIIIINIFILSLCYNIHRFRFLK